MQIPIDLQSGSICTVVNYPHLGSNFLVSGSEVPDSNICRILGIMPAFFAIFLDLSRKYGDSALI